MLLARVHLSLIAQIVRVEAYLAEELVEIGKVLVTHYVSAVLCLLLALATLLEGGSIILTTTDFREVPAQLFPVELARSTSDTPVQK